MSPIWQGTKATNQSQTQEGKTRKQFQHRRKPQEFKVGYTQRKKPAKQPEQKPNLIVQGNRDGKGMWTKALADSAKDA